ncbi:MAG TPA: undecaprenyl-diphosphatase UppP [Gemmatimonadaceae bacterium]|nr:undecaprenyl-diphosphatase UppP [Gemmatimonadaceae bacterium]
MLLQAAAASAAELSVGHAFVLGIVEGLTEFLPVSSTAHLDLARHALRLEPTEYIKSFEIIIQLGAILSVVVLYWRKFLDIEILKKVVVAFIPTGIIGLALYSVIKTYLLGNMTVILAALIIGGVLLIIFEKYHDKGDTPVDFAEITYRRALLIGVFQAIAIVPGVSRSAATIVGGSMIGISKRTIVEFSFILAVPTMAAATGLDLIRNYENLSTNFLSLAVGFVVSFITAIIAIKSFLSFVKKKAFSAFGWYRIVLAVVFFFLFVR